MVDRTEEDIAQDKKIATIAAQYAALAILNSKLADRVDVLASRVDKLARPAVQVLPVARPHWWDRFF